MSDILTKEAERKKRQREKILLKTEAEYQEEILALKNRKDYFSEYDYFLQLLESPFDVKVLQARVKKPIVGLFCIQAPLELFDAFGLQPVKLSSGSYAVQRLAASYLPVLMCPMLKSFMGNFELRKGDFTDYKAIIVPTTCDWVVKLPEIMAMPINNLHYLELPHIKETEKSQTRWLEEFISLREQLEKITGEKLTKEKLEKSVGKFMILWALLARLTTAKRQGKISGVWYTVLTNTFMLDDWKIWKEQLEIILRKVEAQPADLNAATVFVAGSPIIFPNMKLLDLIEEAGMRVVADDLCSSERILPGGIVYSDASLTGMLTAVAERYHKACICPTFADNGRRINNIIVNSEEFEIKGVIFNLLKGCHPYDIESVTIEGKIKARELKFLKIETDYGKEDSQNILTRLEAFKQTL